MTNTSIIIDVFYGLRSIKEIQLPEGLNTNDIEDLYIKWDVANVTLKNGSMLRFELDTPDLDMKRPEWFKVFCSDEQGDPLLEG